MDETGKLLQILEVVERVLPDAIREFAGVMGAAVAPMSNIKELKIVDFGGNAKNGSSLSNFGQVAPEMVTKIVTALTSMNIDTSELFKKLGVDLNNDDHGIVKKEKKDE